MATIRLRIAALEGRITLRHGLGRHAGTRDRQEVSFNKMDSSHHGWRGLSPCLMPIPQFITAMIDSNTFKGGVADVHYVEGNGKPGLLVAFKDRDMFRQYGKADQISSRALKIRKQRCMSEDARKYRPTILAEIEDQVRNELLVGPETMQLFGIEHPSTWTAEVLKKVIDYIWKTAGLSPEQPTSEQQLSPEVEETWRRYLAGEDMRESLPNHKFIRHRAAIKEAKGEDKDIAIPRKSRAVRPEGLGYQLCYDRRWEPTGDLRKSVLCEQTAPAIIEELERGLTFIQSGVVPAFDDPNDCAKWLHRWQEYVAREGGRHHGAK